LKKVGKSAMVLNGCWGILFVMQFKFANFQNENRIKKGNYNEEDKDYFFSCCFYAFISYLNVSYKQ